MRHKLSELVELFLLYKEQLGALIEFLHTDLRESERENILYEAFGESAVTVKHGQRRRAGSPITPADLQLVALRIADEWAQRQERQLGAAINLKKSVKTYLAFLVGHAAGKGSVYTTTAIALILYNFTAKDARDIYEQMLPFDSFRPHQDDARFSDAKRQLIRKLEKRFFKVISFTKHIQGQRTVFPRVHPHEVSDLVLECLERLVMWDTVCFPRMFSESNGGDFFSSRSAPPDILDRRRSHAVVHDACFRRLLKLCRPFHSEPRLRQRLIVPRFKTA